MKESLEYVHINSVGNLLESKKQAREVIPYFKEKYGKNDILGWETIIVRDEEMIDEYYILSNVKEITQNTYPYLFLAIQHKEIENKEITEWIKSNGFVDVG